MMVCITAQGPTLDALVEERFGRTPYFIFMDTGTGSFEAVQNPFSGAGGGVGPRAAQLLVARNAKTLITGQVGGNAKEVLAAAGVVICSCRSGITVRDALDQCRE